LERSAIAPSHATKASPDYQYQAEVAHAKHAEERICPNSMPWVLTKIQFELPTNISQLSYGMGPVVRQECFKKQKLKEYEYDE
jgi:hypothetical protein